MNNTTTYKLADFLTAIHPNRDEKPQIKAVAPRGEVENLFRQPFVYTDISQAELTNQYALAAIAMRTANESKNVLIRAKNACVLMLSSSSQFELLETFTCSPSLRIQIGTRQFVVWLLNDSENIEKTQSELAKLFKTRSANSDENWLPMPEFNLVELDGANYTFTPIELFQLHAERRYKSSELLNAAIIEDKIKSGSQSESGNIANDRTLNTNPTLPNAETQDCQLSKINIAKSFLAKELATLPNMEQQQIIKVAKSQNISERTLRRAKAELNVRSIKPNGVWCWTVGNLESATLPNDLGLAE